MKMKITLAIIAFVLLSYAVTATPCDDLQSNEQNIILLSHNGQIYGCGLTTTQVDCINYWAEPDVMDGLHNLGTCESPEGALFYCADGLDMHYPVHSLTAQAQNYHADFLMFFEPGIVSFENPTQQIMLDTDVKDAKNFANNVLDKVFCDSTTDCKWRYNSFYKDRDNNVMETGSTDPALHKRVSYYEQDFKVQKFFPDGVS